MTTALARPRTRQPTKKQRVLQARASGYVARRKNLPEDLDARQIVMLMELAPNGQGRLIMLAQWRAGLRISEALALEVGDLNLDSDNPTLRVRQGKGSRNDILRRIYDNLPTPRK